MKGTQLISVDIKRLMVGGYPGFPPPTFLLLFYDWNMWKVVGGIGGGSSTGPRHWEVAGGSTGTRH